MQSNKILAMRFSIESSKLFYFEHTSLMKTESNELYRESLEPTYKQQICRTSSSSYFIAETRNVRLCYQTLTFKRQNSLQHRLPIYLQPTVLQGNQRFL